MGRASFAVFTKEAGPSLPLKPQTQQSVPETCSFHKVRDPSLQGFAQAPSARGCP